VAGQTTSLTTRLPTESLWAAARGLDSTAEKAVAAIVALSENVAVHVHLNVFP
jgi:hypothetical protein